MESPVAGLYELKALEVFVLGTMTISLVGYR
jgi:hypothetical protein